MEEWAVRYMTVSRTKLQAYWDGLQAFGSAQLRLFLILIITVLRGRFAPQKGSLANAICISRVVIGAEPEDRIALQLHPNFMLPAFVSREDYSLNFTENCLLTRQFFYDILQNYKNK